AALRGGAPRRPLIVVAARTAKRLDAPALHLRFDAPVLRAARRPGRTARLRDVRGGGDERVQARERLGPVHLEAAVLLGLDDDDAGARHALVAVAQQALLQVLGKGGAAHVEAQVHCVRHLVDVLAAGALRAHGDELDLVLRDGDRRRAWHGREHRSARGKRLAAVVLADRLVGGTAAGRGARILDGAGRPIAVDARPLGREVARARRARLARLALRTVFTGRASQVARRGHRLPVRAHVLGARAERGGERGDQERAFHGALRREKPKGKAGACPLFPGGSRLL